jgi:hypothetical protein
MLINKGQGSANTGRSRVSSNYDKTRRMNAWKINTLMNEHFPKFSAEKQDWVNVQDRDGPRSEALLEVIKKHITTDDLLININRQFGARLPMQDAISFICSHMGQAQIRISNRDFTQFVVVASNCVATGWQTQMIEKLSTGNEPELNV